MILTLTKYVLSLLYLCLPIFLKVTGTLTHVMKVEECIHQEKQCLFQGLIKKGTLLNHEKQKIFLNYNLKSKAVQEIPGISTVALEEFSRVWCILEAVNNRNSRFRFKKELC